MMPQDSIFDLTGQTVLVTGAARGLGKAMAKGFVAAGADVAVADIDGAAAARTAQELAAAGTKCYAIEVDVADLQSVTDMTRTVVEKWGKIDVLVNNAGIGHNAPAEEMEKSDWDRVIAVNLTGVFLCAQSVGREMIRRKQGNIINVSSMSSLVANYPQPQIAYNASKAGVNMVTKSLASEWAQYGIRVNAIAPGYMKTALTKPFFDDPEVSAKWDTQENWVRPTPLQRVGNPDELVGTILYLASDASSFVTGHILVIDGGYTIR
jgi:NAD(P)-dependent dehydrogenase (short-subunit alcohol dehydrogenase family)